MISLARSALSGQSHIETDSSSQYGFVRVHRQGASMKITVAYAFISSLSRFCPLSTGLAAHAREECRAMAEITTLSLQVDLVLSDTAATSEP